MAPKLKPSSQKKSKPSNNIPARTVKLDEKNGSSSKLKRIDPLTAVSFYSVLSMLARTTDLLLVF